MLIPVTHRIRKSHKNKNLEVFQNNKKQKYNKTPRYCTIISVEMYEYIINIIY